MARGFGTTKGSATTDSVTLALTSHATVRTWSLWVKRNVIGIVFSKGATEALSFSSATWRFQRGFSTTSGLWVFSGGTSTGVWIHLMLVYDSSSTSNNPTLYVNGTPSTPSPTTTPVGTATTTATAYRIGNNSTGTNVFDGEVGWFGIWSRALDANDNASLLAGCSPIMVPGAVASVPLFGGAVDQCDGATTVSGTADSAAPPRVSRRGNTWQYGREPPQSIGMAALASTATMQAAANKLSVGVAAQSSTATPQAVAMALTVAPPAITSTATPQSVSPSLSVGIEAATSTATPQALAAELSVAPAALTSSATVQALAGLTVEIHPGAIATSALPQAIASMGLELRPEALASSVTVDALSIGLEIEPSAIAVSSVLQSLGLTRVVSLDALSSTAAAQVLAAELGIGVPALASSSTAYSVSMELAVALGVLPSTVTLGSVSFGGAQVITVGALGSTAVLLALVPYYPPKHPTRVVLLVPAYRKVSVSVPAYRKVRVRP